jgi:hypothetical protein
VHTKFSKFWLCHSEVDKEDRDTRIARLYRKPTLIFFFQSDERRLKIGKEKVYVSFEVSTVETMKNVVFWHIKTQFVPHRRHYVSATEPSRLMLCKI